MNSTSDKDPRPDYAAFVAIDWADQKHSFSLQVAGQKSRETGTLEHKPEVIGAWVAKLCERFGARPVAVALEQSRGALIHALLSYDFLVLYPIHSTTVARFREAFKFSGAKSDPLDTDQILEILTKHLELLKPLNPDTEQTRLLARLVEDRRKAVDLRTSHVQGAKAGLKEYFPQALDLCSDNVTSRLAADLLKKWPTLAQFQQAKASTIKRFFYGHNIRSPEVLQKALDLATTAKALTGDAAIVESCSRVCQMHLQVIQTLNPIIDDYEQRIDDDVELREIRQPARDSATLRGPGAARGDRVGTVRGERSPAGAVKSPRAQCDGADEAITAVVAGPAQQEHGTRAAAAATAQPGLDPGRRLFAGAPHQRSQRQAGLRTRLERAQFVDAVELAHIDLSTYRGADRRGLPPGRGGAGFASAE